MASVFFQTDRAPGKHRAGKSAERGLKGGRAPTKATSEAWGAVYGSVRTPAHGVGGAPHGPQSDIIAFSYMALPSYR